MVDPCMVHPLMVDLSMVGPRMVGPRMVDRRMFIVDPSMLNRLTDRKSLGAVVRG
jgi:hypothetical protein